jgi:hypothetical protein
MNFSTLIPRTGTYALDSNPIESRYITLRTELVSPTSSLYKGLGSQQLQSPKFGGRVGIGTTVGFGT